MSRDYFRLGHCASFLFLLCGLYLFSGLALDSAVALYGSDIGGEECGVCDPGLNPRGKNKLPLVYDGASSSGVGYNGAGGDIVATIMAEGKPVAGETVYFFLAAGENDNAGALFLPGFDDPDYLRSYCATRTNVLGAGTVDFGRFIAIVTDANGRASFNFFRDKYVNFGGLEKALRERGCVRYDVVACVFEEPLEETRAAGIAPRLKYYATAPIEMTSIAAIVGARKP